MSLSAHKFASNQWKHFDSAPRFFPLPTHIFDFPRSRQTIMPYFVQNLKGIPFILINCRGSGNSSVHFRPIVPELFQSFPS